MVFDKVWREFIKQHPNTPDSMRPMIREAMRMAYHNGHDVGYYEGYDAGWDAHTASLDTSIIDCG